MLRPSKASAGIYVSPALFMNESGNENDDALMARVCRGDHAAFSILVRRHSKMFFSAAYRMSGNVQASEDIVQEAFIKLWNKPQAWDPGKGTKFTTWFYRVVTNLAIDRQRREKGFVNPVVMETIADHAPRADEALQRDEEQIMLEAAIQSLPDRQKTALNLCVYEGLSNREAADVMGIGVKALESLLMRAKAGLKTEFERKGFIKVEDDKGNERRRSHA